MITLYHGSPFKFDSFAMDKAGDATGVKYGYGVYLTERYATAVHYSQPRNMEFQPHHYVYTVEIDDITPDNQLVSAKPVPQSIVACVEEKLGCKAPDEDKQKGKLFRKWVGLRCTGLQDKDYTKNKLAVEKAAAELLDSLGVHFMVWPVAQTQPDGDRNIAVFDPAKVKICQCDSIDIERKGDKWVVKQS